MEPDFAAAHQNTMRILGNLGSAQGNSFDWSNGSADFASWGNAGAEAMGIQINIFKQLSAQNS
jgi:hypothetical protein